MELVMPAFDRIAATFAAVVVIGLAVFLLVRNQPISDPKLFFVLRVIVSFGVATLGATIPGFLDLGWSGRGLAVRAGGALALFVLTFIYTPDLATGLSITQNSSGPQSPPIAGNSGTIIINGGETKK
jgi:hypothetical protein